MYVFTYVRTCVPHWLCMCSHYIQYCCVTVICYVHYPCCFMLQAVLQAATTEMDELVEKIGQHVNVPVRDVLNYCHIDCTENNLKQ